LAESNGGEGCRARAGFLPEEEEADARARAVRERRRDLPGGVLLSAEGRERRYPFGFDSGMGRGPVSELG
jgi:hypothetical protein